MAGKRLPNITAFSDWTTGNEAGPTAIGPQRLLAFPATDWGWFLAAGSVLACTCLAIQRLQHQK